MMHRCGSSQTRAVRRAVPVRRATVLLTACLLLLLLAVAWGGVVCSVRAQEDVAEASESTAVDVDHAATPLDTVAEFHEVAAAAEAAAAALEAEDHPDLDTLSEEELKALLSDKKKGQVNFKRYKNRDDLITAIREVDAKEQAQRAFRDKVAAAAQWYAETQEEKSYQRAAARRAKTSRIKHGGEVPAALRYSQGTEAKEGPRYALRVLYSEASNYGKHFTALVKDLESSETTRLPNLDAFRVVGEPYPVSKETALFSQLLQVAFYGVMALAVVPDLVPFIPEQARNLVRTRRGLVISTAFMLNMLGRSLLHANAFEVYFGDELIYSAMKLGGRLPTSEMVSNMLLERTLLKEYAAAMGGAAAAATAAAAVLL